MIKIIFYYYMYDIGIFVDNSEFNFENSELYPNIIPIQLYETENEDEVIGEKHLCNYINLLINEESKKDIKYIKNLNCLKKCKLFMEDAIDYNSGMTISHIKNIIKLIKESNEYNVKFIVLDFDRTITKVEGLHYYKNLKRENLSDLDIIKYYLGGINRIHALHNLFNFLHSKNIDLFILTNNEAINSIYHLLKLSKLNRNPLKLIQYNICDTKYDTMDRLFSKVPKYNKIFNSKYSLSKTHKKKLTKRLCKYKDDYVKDN